MKQNEIRLVPMEEAHVSQIAQIEILCFSSPWNEDSVRSELTNPLSLWLVALDGERVVGYVGSQSVLGEADLMNIAVLPAYRRQRIALRLLDELQKALHAQGVCSITLEVRASNDAAIRLYEFLGYIQVGRRPNYYFKPKEDALILRKEWSL